MKQKILIIGIVLAGLLIITALVYFLALPIFRTAKAAEAQTQSDLPLIDQPTFDLTQLDSRVVSMTRSFAAVE